MIIWCNITWFCCMTLLLIVSVWYNQMIMHFLWFATCIFILVLFRIQQHIAEPYFKIVSRTAQLRRLQVSLVRFQYVSRNNYPSLRMAEVSPRSSPLRDVSRGGTSATQRQKFYTDDAKSVRNLIRRTNWLTE